MAAMSRGIFAVALVLLCVAAVAVHGRSNANRHAAADPTPVPRSFDGSGNNPANTEWGAAGQPFLRPYGVPDPSVPGGVRYTAYGDGKSTLARQGGPNPRAVSSGPMASKPGSSIEGRCVVAAVARVVWHSASSAWRARVWALLTQFTGDTACWLHRLLHSVPHVTVHVLGAVLDV